MSGDYNFGDVDWLRLWCGAVWAVNLRADYLLLRLRLLTLFIGKSCQWQQDHRECEEYRDSWNVPGAELKRGMPDDVVLEMSLDGHSAIVALTHDPKLDDMALLEALKSPAFYIGAIGSKKNNEARRKRLAEFDLSAEEIARLHGPVGLKLGSKTPPEIAISILAEMTAIRNGVKIPELIEPPRPTVAGCAA